MEPGPYPDPFAEAITSGSQKVAQIASLAATASQVILQQLAIRETRKATTDEQALCALTEQEQQIRQQTRMAWAPATDRRWLANADLLQTARAWAAAAAHSDGDPVAASAMRKCEDRLRTLHPYAMTYYDQLRQDGATPLSAMSSTAPLFSRPAHVRTGDTAPDHPALAATTEQQQPAETDSPVKAGEHRGDGPARAENRARQIAHQLQDRAREHDQPPLGREELTIVLKTITNLPYPIIETIASESKPIQQNSGGTPARLTVSNFPHNITSTVRAIGIGSAAQTRSHQTLPIGERNHVRDM